MLAWSLVGIPTHPEGKSRHQAEERKERHEPAPPAHRADGPSPVNCRKVMTTCVQTVAMFGAELLWNGDQTQGAIGRTY